MSLIDTGVKVIETAMSSAVRQCRKRSLLDLPLTRLKAAALHEPEMHIDSISHLYPGVP